MKIAGNKLEHLRQYYFDELSTLMEPGEIEAQFALACEHYLKMDRKTLHLNLHENINQSDLLFIYDCCKAIKNNTPIQYILGEAHFYGLTFKVSPAVLIPRPETEELVDIFLKRKKNIQSLLDIGTGSACIPIAFKKKLPAARVSACDVSLQALAIANENALFNQTDINLFECDVLSEQNSIVTSNNSYDLIVSNPPYILHTEQKNMHLSVIEHEPHVALFVKGEDPIIFYKKIIEICQTHLNAGGDLLFELNPLTAQDVYEYASKSDLFKDVQLINDMSGKTRFLSASKN